MIIVKLIGGLGNQLFQYALGRNLAIKNNCQLKLDISAFQEYKLRKYSLNHFNIEETFATEDDKNEVMKKRHFYRLTSKIRNKKEPEFKNYYHEKHFHFDPEVLNIQGNAYLDGYWQSEKYFIDVSKRIKSELTLKEELDIENLKVAQDIKESSSVGVHIRRGDFVNDSLTKAIHGVCDLSYYHSAIENIISRIKEPVFFIFSDDHQWAKDSVKIKYPCKHIDFNNADKNYADLYLMSLCDHNIVANSTFSWWGAWLNCNPQKTVISPSRWFKSEEFNTIDLYPQDWVKL